KAKLILLAVDHTAQGWGPIPTDFGRDGHAGNEFYGTDITGSALGARDPALVVRLTIIVGRAGIEGRAAGDEGMGIGGAAVVSQGGIHDGIEGSRESAVRGGGNVCCPGYETGESLSGGQGRMAKEVEVIGGNRPSVVKNLCTARGGIPG